MSGFGDRIGVTRKHSSADDRVFDGPKGKGVGAAFSPLSIMSGLGDSTGVTREHSSVDDRVVEGPKWKGEGAVLNPFPIVGPW